MTGNSGSGVRKRRKRGISSFLIAALLSHRINNDFRFDDAMAAEGCEVFSFDPR